MESNSINILEQNNAAIAKAYVDLSPEDKPTLPAQRQPSFSLLSKVGSYPAVSTAVSSASSIYNTTKQRFKITAFTDKLEDGLKFVVSSVQDSRLEPYLLQVDQFSVTQLEKIESRVTEGKEAISEKAKKSKAMAQEKLIQPTQHIFEMVYLPSKKAVDATTNAVSTTWRVIRHPTSSILSTTEYVLHTIDDKVDYYLPSTPLAIDENNDKTEAESEEFDSKAEELIVENSTTNDEQSTTTTINTSTENDVNDDTNCSTSSNAVSVVQRQRQTNHLLEADKETTATTATTFFFLASSAYNVSFKIATRLSCKVLRRLKRTAIYNRAVKSSYYTTVDAKIRSIDIVLLKQQLSDKVQHLPAVSYLLKKYTDATVTTTTTTTTTDTETTTTTTDADQTSTTTADGETNNNNAQQTYKDLLVTNSKWALLNAKESLSVTLTTFYCTYFAPALQRYIPTNWKSNEQPTQTSTTVEQVEATITTTAQDEQLETTTIAEKQDIATTTTTEESTTPEQVESTTTLLETVQEEEEQQQEQPENEQTEQPQNEQAGEQIEQNEQVVEQTEQPQIEQEVDVAEEVEDLENTFDSLVQLIEGDGEINEEEEVEANSLNQLEQYFDDDNDDTDESNNNNDVDDDEVVVMLPNQTSSIDA